MFKQSNFSNAKQSSFRPRKHASSWSKRLRKYQKTPANAFPALSSMKDELSFGQIEEQLRALQHVEKEEELDFSTTFGTDIKRDNVSMACPCACQFRLAEELDSLAAEVQWLRWFLLRQGTPGAK